jgi:hypothetical protein
MSSREKHIVVTLACFTILLGYYLVNWIRMYQTVGLDQATIFRLWATVIIAGIVVTIVGTILTHIGANVAHAIKTGGEEPAPMVEDERDKLIELKGEYVSYIVFALGVFIAMLSFVFGQPALMMFSLIVFFSLLAQVVGDISQLVRYRKGV